jgi:hypothetical protein
MGRIYPSKKTLNDDLVLTPHEINEELQTIIGEFNGRLDRENIALGSIDSTKIKNKTFSNYEYQGRPISPVAFPPNAGPLDMVFIGQPVGTMAPIPALQFGEDQMFLNIDTLDGGLIVEGSVSIATLGPDYSGDPVEFDVGAGWEDRAQPYNWPWSLVITVDGRVVAESGMSAGNPYSSRHVKQYVPVAAGTHKVALWLRTGASGRTPDPNYPATYESLIQLPLLYRPMARTVYARHIKR